MSDSMRRRGDPHKLDQRTKQTNRSPDTAATFLFSDEYSLWAPTSRYVFFFVLFARLYAAVWSNISDCDETYNYWEPLHYITRGHGFQTWEYSPQYAVRSYAYLWVYALPLNILAALGLNHKMFAFYFLRVLMAVCCTLCETLFYSAVCRRYGRNVGGLLLCFLLLSTGMFISSTAFLPSSFSMYMTALAMAFWYNGSYPAAIFTVAASAIIGWPFAAALGLPIACDVVFMKKRIITFIQWSLISACICLVPLVLIDTCYYGKLVVAPLNIVLYNVFSEHGPDIYGVEPWTFYFFNGFLNFNFVFPLALAAVPVVIIVNFILKHRGVSKPHTYAELPVWLGMAPMYIWLLIFFTRPHKEERFLFPVYPLFCLGGALALDHIQRLLYLTLSPRRTPPDQYTRNRLVRLVTFMFCCIFIITSLSRSIALYKGYHAPLDVYSDLTQIASDLDRHDLPANRQVNVCVGKEWYRFTSNFFMPNEKWKLQFLKSEFRGQLPKPYDSGANATRIIPSHMNDQNLEEHTRYIDTTQCHYIVDLDLPGKTLYEPKYSQNRIYWKVMASVDFLDAARSHKFFRAFYIPFISDKLCIYSKYNLLQSTRYKDLIV